MSRFFHNALTRRFIGGSLFASAAFTFKQRSVRAFEHAEVNEKLISACKEFDFGCVELALKSGADPNMEIDGIPAILFAIHFTRRVTEKALILAHDNSEPESMIQIMIRLFKTRTYLEVKPLVEAGADVNAVDNHGQTPLMVACATCNVPLIEYLLSKGADVTVCSKDDETAFGFLMLYGISGPFSEEVSVDLMEKLTP